MRSPVFTAVLIAFAAGLTACGPEVKTDLKNREKLLWNNMKEIQMGVEHYAANHGGEQYPTEIDESFKSYLTGGGDDGRTPRPVGFINPWTNKNEWPDKGNFVGDVEALRKGPAPDLQPGKIVYSCTDGKTYTILAGTYDGKAMRDYNNDVLVFSNRSPYYPPPETSSTPLAGVRPDEKLNNP